MTSVIIGSVIMRFYCSKKANVEKHFFSNKVKSLRPDEGIHWNTSSIVFVPSVGTPVFQGAVQKKKKTFRDLETSPKSRIHDSKKRFHDPHTSTYTISLQWDCSKLTKYVGVPFCLWRALVERLCDFWIPNSKVPAPPSCPTHIPGP